MKLTSKSKIKSIIQYNMIDYKLPILNLIEWPSLGLLFRINPKFVLVGVAHCANIYELSKPIMNMTSMT